MKGHNEPRPADDVGAAPRCLTADEPGRGQRTGVKVALVHIQPHAVQLLLQLLRRPLGGVGEEQEILLLPIQPLHKLLHPRQQTVPMIDHTVHVADKALLLSQFLHGSCSFLNWPFSTLILYLAVGHNPSTLL